MVPQPGLVPQASGAGASCMLCSIGSVRASAGRSRTCLHAKRSPSLLAPEPEVSDQEPAERDLPLWDELMAFPEHLDRISSRQRASSSTPSQPVQDAQHSRTRPTAVGACYCPCIAAGFTTMQPWCHQKLEHSVNSEEMSWLRDLWSTAASLSHADRLSRPLLASLC